MTEELRRLLLQIDGNFELCLKALGRYDITCLYLYRYVTTSACRRRILIIFKTKHLDSFHYVVLGTPYSSTSRETLWRIVSHLKRVGTGISTFSKEIEDFKGLKIIQELIG